MTRRARWGRAALVLLGLGTAAMPLLASASPAGAATPLNGNFTITAGSCSGGVASGTYLRMVLSGGTNSAGPFFSNSDSTCSDQTYTPLVPGTSGGLVAGTYQPQPSPAFDSSGNALANEITSPVAFEGVRFSTATNPVDPQTGLKVPAPSIEVSGSTLGGNLQSFGVSWNKQEFNQGSPKPDGSSPANTTPVTGTYNAATGAYTLQWSSQVVGGPFNGFSAFWNLTGRFVPASTAAAPTPAASSSGSAAPATSPASTSSSASHSTSPAAGTSAGSVAASSGTATGTASSSTSSTTTPPSAHPKSVTRTVLASRVVTESEGWSAPTWLAVLIGLAAVLGLAGVLWSERAIRRLRSAGSPAE